MFPELVEVVAQSVVEDDLAVVFRGMKEAQNSVFIPRGDADVGGVGLVPGGDDTNDVAIAQLLLDAGHLSLRDVGDTPAGEFVFHPDKFRDHGGIGPQLAVKMRLFPHISHAPVEFFATERGRDVFDQSATLVVLDPVLQMVQP